MTALPEAFDLAPEQPISVDIGIADGIFVKQHRIPLAGTYVPQHSHTYDHITALTAGAIEAWADGEYLGRFDAPKLITIKAHTKHTFMTLMPDTILHCIHNIERTGVVVEEEHHHLVPPAVEMDDPDENGFTFQQEPFERLVDGIPLMEEHCASVGEAKDEWKRKNIPLMRKLAKAGALHVTTARCNGKMFGYVISIVAPSLYATDRQEAYPASFYCSPSAPGLGLKLHRATLKFLRSIGVDEVIYRAGPRGMGPRLGALYRRLGAQDAGSLYLLEMGA